MSKELRIALRNAGRIHPESIDDYIAAGGYKALKTARETDRGELIAMLERTGRLRGRGGAAFNTGLKWSSAAQVNSAKKYMICNADEGEPGTYKDREIMESDPHTVIEGILIGAYAVGTDDCYIYCRGEYRNAIRLLELAVQQAEGKGLCDGVSIQVAYGAGSYVCGEETALISSLEGRRGEPRLKPPYPTVEGFRGKPTVVNNVETFAVIPVIVSKGADWFSGIGAAGYPGTKVFSLSGDVKNRGCFEAPTDITLRDIVEGFGGGVTGTGRLKAVQLGGSSCAFITPDKLDTPVDVDSMRSIGGSLGSGATLILDDSHNIVDILAGIAEFFEHESCGKCIPCREGTLRVRELLSGLAEGRGKKEGVAKLGELCDLMEMSCFCPLGQSATTALKSALELFPGDFDAKLRAREG